MDKEKRPHVDFISFIRESQYYKKRRDDALAGENTASFVEELEVLISTIWNAMLQLADDLDKIKSSLHQAENERSRLQDMILSQYFDKISDGPTQ